MKVVVAVNKKEIIDNFLVRGKVFVIGQEIDYEIEFDGLDNDCTLFTAYIDEIPVGAARLYKNKVGRVATLVKYRKQGVASELMSFIEEHAKEIGLTELILNAQLYVKDFYEHLGYIPVGDIFQEAEIDHIKMKKEL
ncbi:putative N-acetyltransferase YjcF [Candidatus Izimaplasma bacterium HR1]|jgi:predicted GNAT family N-acyltransferase|uniref:GNAT family N-acetyltransferase n=1 Tax=Candidatus Izimoplasma sp. HR1 TaxID=1541959 RepID=UPI0004F8FEAF|nr:putative N-acetyltransferase YjcF [Candidatus Izimaplasma bacterium HR1]